MKDVAWELHQAGVVRSMLRGRLDFPCLKDYWYSTEAEKLFAPLGEETPHEACGNMVQVLHKALGSDGDVLLLVQGFEHPDKKGELNPKELSFHSNAELLNFRRDIQQRALYLRSALLVALEHDGKKSTLNWKDCCTEGIKRMNLAGFDRIKGTDQLGAWYRLFRNGGRKFPNILRDRKSGPLLFKYFPQLKNVVRKYIDDNLETINKSQLRDHLIQKIIPDLIEKEELELPPVEDEELEDTPTQRFLCFYGMPAICEATCNNIMHYLGSTFENTAQNFYTNNHEKFLEDRIEYTWEYINELEPHFPVYVKLPLTEVLRMKSNRKLDPKVMGHSFQKDGEEWREFHFNACEAFFERLLRMPLEERYSVKQQPGDPRYIPVGHDEACVAQYEFSKKCWKGSKGQQPLRKKGRGKTIMMSGLVSKVFLWNPKITDEELEQINALREGADYVDTVAALEMNHTTKKPLLTHEDLPFLQILEVGANCQGWWNGANMHLQLEDFGDCCKVLYPGYTVLFFTDWSQGHSRKRPDGLDATRMNKGYGGAQIKSHESHLHRKCFGPHTYPGMLSKPSNSTSTVKQSFCFQDSDEGPCYMSHQQQQENKYDRVIPGKYMKSHFTIAQLRDALRIGVQHDQLPPNIEKLNKSQLKAVCEQKNIATFKMIPKIVQGWLGKPKGLLQILWETGWVDGNEYKGAALYEYYNKEGKKDAAGNLIPGTNLVAILQERHDFKNELTMMEYVGKRCGLIVKMSPKCHCEIAGESIEVVWGIGKVRLRRIPHSDRDTAEKFRALVEDMWSKDKIGYNQLRGAFRTHRAYILSYYEIHKEQAAEKGLTVEQLADPSIVKDLVESVDYKTIEEKMKSYKSHPNAMDFMGKVVRQLADLPTD